jgi:spermidine/putrescine transport system substrate-binding protein
MKKTLLVMMSVIMVVSVLLAGCAAAPSAQNPVELRFYNWGDYIEPGLIAQFEKEYPWIKVNYTTYPSNEDMYTMLKSGGKFDLVIPSDYMVQRLISEGMLEKIDTAALKNFSNITDFAKGQGYDPKNEYSVAYMWGTLGILYNTTLVSDPVDSWDILWDAKYSKKIVMYDSVRDSMAVALLKTGHSVNSRDEADLQAAFDALVQQKPLVMAYMSDDVKDTMVSGSASLAVVYSGDAMICQADNGDLAYVIPKEGSNVWYDAMAIPKGSEHKAEALLLMDFLCRPDVAKVNSEYIGYSTPNKAALDLMDDSYKSDPVFNPPADVLARCTVYLDLGDTMQKKYNELWEQLKAK